MTQATSPFLNRPLRSLAEVMPCWRVDWKDGEGNQDFAYVRAISESDAIAKADIPKHALTWAEKREPVAQEEAA